MKNKVLLYLKNGRKVCVQPSYSILFIPYYLGKNILGSQTFKKWENSFISTVYLCPLLIDLMMGKTIEKKKIEVTLGKLGTVQYRGLTFHRDYDPHTYVITKKNLL